MAKKDAIKAEDNKGFKLNIKRTTYIGLAFFTIMMLWQVYNTYCPLFLKDFFVQNYGGTSADHAYLVGIIMAMDNVFALFMLPIFGTWSDKTKSKLGKRMPFIIVGVVLAVICFPLIPLMFIKNEMVWLIIMMGIILLAMNVYRSPAVALMPDITPKPLRSKANAIINVLGYVGAIFAGAMAIVFKASTDSKTHRLVYDANTIWIPFVITAVLMVIALVILILTIKENKLAVEMADEMERGEKVADTAEVVVEDKPLTGRNKTNMIILLASIFLWFFAFNALETFGSTFGDEVLHASSGWWGTMVIVMTICSLVGFFPGAYLSEKIGRRKTIIVGLLIMIIALCITIFNIPIWLYYPLVGIAGIGWAWVNVNSYPMVVEMASKKNIGKLTGWYYAASMLAQSLTPICIGFLFGILGYEFMFAYAVIFSTIALIVFCFYKSTKDDTKVASIESSKPENAVEKVDNEPKLAKIQNEKQVIKSKQNSAQKQQKSTKSTNTNRGKTSKTVTTKKSQDRKTNNTVKVDQKKNSTAKK